MIPGLSVCMIVKNEETNIKEAIKSFSPFADEIIINDTGSNDNTNIIIDNLSSYQPSHPDVIHITTEWKDDFSHSRNLSLNEATRQWIIWLDADDRIPEESVNDLLKLKTAPLDRCFQFRIKNTLQGLPLGAQWVQLRMFPNRKDIRFEGGIHEQIGYSCYRAGLNEICLDTEIHHTGYDNEELSIEKTKRNIRLMKKHGFGKNDTEKCGIAAAHYKLKAWREGLKIYKDIHSRNKANEHIKFQLPGLIGRGYYHIGEINNAIFYFDKADENNIEAMYEKAQCYECTHMFEKALKCYLKVINSPEIVLVQAQDYHFCRMHSFHLAWRIMSGLKMHKESINLLNHMHTLYPKFKLER